MKLYLKQLSRCMCFFAICVLAYHQIMTDQSTWSERMISGWMLVATLLYLGLAPRAITSFTWRNDEVTLVRVAHRRGWFIEFQYRLTHKQRGERFYRYAYHNEATAYAAFFDRVDLQVKTCHKDLSMQSVAQQGTPKMNPIRFITKWIDQCRGKRPNLSVQRFTTVSEESRTVKRDNNTVTTYVNNEMVFQKTYDTAKDADAGYAEQTAAQRISRR